jgi:hypothetical protein
VAIFLDEMHTAAAATAAAAAAAAAAAPLPSAASRAGDEAQPARVVVEMQTCGALPLVKYACSSCVTALSTNHYNAIRLAKMIKRPVLSQVGVLRGRAVGVLWACWGGGGGVLGACWGWLWVRGWLWVGCGGCSCTAGTRGGRREPPPLGLHHLGVAAAQARRFSRARRGAGSACPCRGSARCLLASLS